MGYHNVAAVSLYWAHLSHAPYRLLQHMAMQSLDPPGRNGTAPCMYWGNVEAQALAMGLRGKNSARQLRKTRARLVEAGALELVQRGTKTRAPVWLVVTQRGAPEPSHLPWLDGTY